jgi:phage terminase large subunit-like protein
MLAAWKNATDSWDMGCDELAAWKNATDSWDMAMLGLRIGRNPQSPDRLDALLWAMTDLFLRGHQPTSFPSAYVVQHPRNIPGQ